MKGKIAFLNLLTPLGKVIFFFSMKHVVCGSSASAVDCSCWSWNPESRCQAEQDLLSHWAQRKGREREIAKNVGKVTMPQNLWLSLSHALVANMLHSPTPVSSVLGMGAWENVRDSCEREGLIHSEERRLPKSQGPSDPFRPDLQTVSWGEGDGDEFAVALGVGGSMLDMLSIIIIEILYQVPGCLSWRA